MQFSPVYRVLISLPLCALALCASVRAAEIDLLETPARMEALAAGKTALDHAPKPEPAQEALPELSSSEDSSIRMRVLNDEDTILETPARLERRPSANPEIVTVRASEDALNAPDPETPDPAPIAPSAEQRAPHAQAEAPGVPQSPADSAPEVALGTPLGPVEQQVPSPSEPQTEEPQIAEQPTPDGSGIRMRVLDDEDRVLETSARLESQPRAQSEVITVLASEDAIIAATPETPKSAHSAPVAEQSTPQAPASAPSLPQVSAVPAPEVVLETPLAPVEQQMTSPSEPQSEEPQIAEQPAPAAAADAQPESDAVPAPVTAPSDSEFMIAREAFRKKKHQRLAELVPALKNHPLGAYVEYWNLLLELRMDPADPARQKAMSRFIAAHHGEYIAERARTDWARVAASEGDAARFNRLYKALAWNQTEPDLACWKALYDLQAKRRGALKAAKDQLLNAPAGKDACTQLGLATIAADPRWGWNYILILVQKRHFTLARKTIEVLPASALPTAKSQLTAIIGNPTRWYARNKRKLSAFPGKVLALASLRLVQADLEKAAEVAQAANARIDPAMRALMWGTLGLEAALKQNLDALSYYQRAGVLARSEHIAVNYPRIAAWRARSAVLSGNFSEVERAIETLPRQERVKSTWVYWRGRALLARGQKARAAKLLRPLCAGYEFYDLLSCDALGLEYAKMPRHLNPPITKAQIRSFEKNPSLKRALRFYENNLVYEGNREWNWAYRGMKLSDMPHLAEYARLLGITHRQINSAQRGQSAVLELLYPRAYEQPIKNAAAAANLPEYWVFGLIRQESRFVPYANSSVGAKGLMQLMPGTARWVARKMSMTGYRRSQITNLNTNLIIGSHYLKMVQSALEGSVPLATAGYNAGPNRPQLWRSRLKKPVEGAAFAENIPFNETRGYVRNVTANAVHYSRYEGKPVRLTELLGTIMPSENTRISLP